jgi:hypothetical protein
MAAAAGGEEGMQVFGDRDCSRERDRPESAGRRERNAMRRAHAQRGGAAGRWCADACRRGREGARLVARLRGVTHGCVRKTRFRLLRQHLNAASPCSRAPAAMHSNSQHQAFAHAACRTATAAMPVGNAREGTQKVQPARSRDSQRAADCRQQTAAACSSLWRGIWSCGCQLLKAAAVRPLGMHQHHPPWSMDVNSRPRFASQAPSPFAPRAAKASRQLRRSIAASPAHKEQICSHQKSHTHASLMLTPPLPPRVPRRACSRAPPRSPAQIPRTHARQQHAS